MRFPLTAAFVADAGAHGLRAGCPHCFHFVGGDGAAHCGNGWPLEGQERFPPDAAPPDGSPPPTEVVFCREFELA